MTKSKFDEMENDLPNLIHHNVNWVMLIVNPSSLDAFHLSAVC